MATTAGMTSVGSALVTALLKASSIKYIGWGTGTGDFAAANTALQAAAAEARTSGTQDDVQTDHTDDTYQVVGTIACASAGKTITEVGIFSADAAGSMYFRAHFDGMALDIADSIEFTIKVKHDHSA